MLEVKGMVWQILGLWKGSRWFKLSPDLDADILAKKKCFLEYVRRKWDIKWYKWWSYVARYQDIIEEHCCKRMPFSPRLLADKLNIAYFLKIFYISFVSLLIVKRTTSKQPLRHHSRVEWGSEMHCGRERSWKKELMCNFAKIDVNYLPRKCLFLPEWFLKTSLLLIALQTGISLTWCFA